MDTTTTTASSSPNSSPLYNNNNSYNNNLSNSNNNSSSTSNIISNNNNNNYTINNKNLLNTATDVVNNLIVDTEKEKLKIDLLKQTEMSNKLETLCLQYRQVSFLYCVILSRLLLDVNCFSVLVGRKINYRC